MRCGPGWQQNFGNSLNRRQNLLMANRRQNRGVTAEGRQNLGRLADRRQPKLLQQFLDMGTQPVEEAPHQVRRCRRLLLFGGKRPRPGAIRQLLRYRPCSLGGIGEPTARLPPRRAGRIGERLFRLDDEHVFDCDRLRTVDPRLGDIQGAVYVGRVGPRLPPCRMTLVERREERRIAAERREQHLQSSDALVGRLPLPFRHRRPLERRGQARDCRFLGLLHLSFQRCAAEIG